MRGRTPGVVLIVLSLLAVVAAVLLPTVLAPRLVVLPLDQSTTSIAAGDDLSYLDQTTFEQVTAASVTVQQVVTGDPDSADASDATAVWAVTQTVATADGTALSTADFTVCLDRRTAESVACAAAAIGDDEDAQVDGLSVTFPFDTAQQTYQLYDATAGASFPATFDGEQQLGGLGVYRFEQPIPETVIRTALVPATLAGGSGAGFVTADVVYSNERTLLVEPTSGVVVGTEENPLTVLRGPDGATGATAVGGKLTIADDTQADQVDTAADTRGQIRLLTVTGPLVVGGIGVLLLLGGAVLLVRGRRRAGSAASMG